MIGINLKGLNLFKKTALNSSNDIVREMASYFYCMIIFKYIDQKESDDDKVKQVNNFLKTCLAGGKKGKND